MHFQSLAKRGKWLKKDKKGIIKMSTTLDKFIEKRLKEEREEGENRGMKKGLKKGREEGRVRMIGLLLRTHSADALLHDPQFTPLGCAQADIDAALALQKK